MRGAKVIQLIFPYLILFLQRISLIKQIITFQIHAIRLIRCYYFLAFLFLIIPMTVDLA